MNIYQKALMAIRKGIAGTPVRMTYASDGFGVRKKYVPFGRHHAFDAAWDHVEEVNRGLWAGGDLADIRWRCHTCIWAAQTCLRLPGDFAEFGVNTGILSSMILRTTDFSRSGKKFYLFDTFAGIPEEMATETERKSVRKKNEGIYSHDGLAVAKRAFSGFEENVEFVVGRLPDTLENSGIDQLSYVSIDLNSVNAEMAVINDIWNKIVPGGLIVLDDFGFPGFEEQREAWLAFAAGHDRMILSVPTGQGILAR